MQGGVIRDTLDAAGIDLGRGAGRPPAGAALPFDEKLRRLHRLRQEGLISEEEYQRERKEVLDQN
jgi:Short C-terminal domain